MESLVVYDSKFGNTKKVAEAVADGLRSHGPVRLLGLDRLLPQELGTVDQRRRHLRYQVQDAQRVLGFGSENDREKVASYGCSDIRAARKLLRDPGGSRTGTERARACHGLGCEAR